MLQTVPYTQEGLLKERRESAVRAMIRAVGYALTRGSSVESIGHFLFESYRHSGEFKRVLQYQGTSVAAAFATWHLRDRWGWCDDVDFRYEDGAMVVESASMLANQEMVMGFHGVTRSDMEACVDTLWRLSGRELGLDITYTVGDARDWLLIRSQEGAPVEVDLGQVDVPVFTKELLAAHRRFALATGIVCSIGYAKFSGDEPEDLGRFFYRVWEGSGHYDRLRERFGFGNALAYAQSVAQSRQVLYSSVTMIEDLDGFTIASPSWSTEIPHVMGTFGVLPDDVYRYFAGGGVAACARLGLQYTDRSDDRVHRVWIRSR